MLLIPHCDSDCGWRNSALVVRPVRRVVRNDAKTRENDKCDEMKAEPSFNASLSSLPPFPHPSHSMNCMFVREQDSLSPVKTPSGRAGRGRGRQ